jgi:hypothetical protein
MALAFAGSDDMGDWIQNAQAYPGGPGNKYHKGFYEYQDTLAQCVNGFRNKLKNSWGIELDYITGHSLGGAAATIYAQEHGLPHAGVATYGAPKTNYDEWIDVKGWRFMHENDPVTSNLCFLGCIMAPLKHVIERAFEYTDKLIIYNVAESKRVQDKRKKCQKKWWKFWCWFEYVWVTVTELVQKSRFDKCISPQKTGGSPGGVLSGVFSDSGKYFVHNFYNLIVGAWGALDRHSAYDAYPQINVFNIDSTSQICCEDSHATCA